MNKLLQTMKSLTPPLKPTKSIVGTLAHAKFELTGTPEQLAQAQRELDAAFLHLPEVCMQLIARLNTKTIGLEESALMDKMEQLVKVVQNDA